MAALSGGGQSSISGMQSGATAGLNSSDAVTSARQSGATRGLGADSTSSSFNDSVSREMNAAKDENRRQEDAANSGEIRKLGIVARELRRMAGPPPAELFGSEAEPCF